MWNLGPIMIANTTTIVHACTRWHHNLPELWHYLELNLSTKKKEGGRSPRSYHIVGSAAIKAMAKQSGISDRFTSSNMRKFVATQML